MTKYFKSLLEIEDFKIYLATFETLTNGWSAVEVPPDKIVEALLKLSPELQKKAILRLRNMNIQPSLYIYLRLSKLANA